MVEIDAKAFHRELARRGITQGQLAATAGIAEYQLSLQLRRGVVRPSSFARLLAALQQYPVLEGADELLGKVS